MTPALTALAGWIRRRIAWSNSPRAWQERGTLLGLLALAIAIGWLGHSLELLHQVALWVVFLAVAAVLLRQGLFRLFGPVLFYELLRTARRSRYALLRSAYAIFLLMILFSVYQSFRGFDSGGMEARQMAQLAEAFFFTFMGIQYSAVALLTPAYTAGAIAEEKDTKTLEFLLATDLENREIILGKQCARFANMGLLVLAGLPILAMTQFLGGVDPDLVLLGFAATGLTMLGLGSLSILCSLYARKARSAIIMTYLVMLAYVASTGCAYLLVMIVGKTPNPSVSVGSVSVNLLDILEAIGIGNPFLILSWVGTSYGRGQALRDVIVPIFRGYAIFYSIVTLVCTSWSVVRLRVVALKQAHGETQKLSRMRRRRRAAVSNRPMVWKEVHIEPGLRVNWLGRIAVVLLVLASFAPFAVIIASFIDDSGASRWFSYAINGWVRGVGTAVACLTLLGVALHASSSVTGERDRQTWDSLLTTPLESGDILYGKWLGSVVSMRWGWAWLGVIWAIGVVTGGMSPLAVPMLIGGWFLYAAFLAGLGLWFSITARTTLRANLWTLGTTAVLAVGHWLPWITCCLPFGAGKGAEEIAKFQSFALTPPVTLGWFAFHGEEFGRAGSGVDSAAGYTGYAIIGLFIWSIGALFMWGLTHQRFRELTNRTGALPRRDQGQSNMAPFGEAIDDNAKGLY